MSLKNDLKKQTNQTPTQNKPTKKTPLKPCECFLRLCSLPGYKLVHYMTVHNHGIIVILNNFCFQHNLIFFYSRTQPTSFLFISYQCKHASSQSLPLMMTKVKLSPDTWKVPFLTVTYDPACATDKTHYWSGTKLQNSSIH